MHKLFFILSLAALLPACGREVTESKMAFYPPKPRNCAIDLLPSTPLAEMGNTGAWEVVGVIAVGGAGSEDPFSPKNREVVRPRACAMGADAVAVMGTADGPRSRGTTYTVLRRRQPAAATPVQRL